MLLVLAEALLMSTHNICIFLERRKKISAFFLKKKKKKENKNK